MTRSAGHWLTNQLTPARRYSVINIADTGSQMLVDSPGDTGSLVQRVQPERCRLDDHLTYADE